MLCNNDYSVWFIEKYIKIRSKKFKHGHTHNLRQNHYEKLPKLSFPFNKDSISNILKSYNIGTIPLVKKSLSTIIRLGKDMTKKWDRTNVLYKFDCKNCSATYIGKTKRSLRTRINEHKTNKNKESVMSLHRIENKHEFDCENTSVLDMESNYKEKLVSEMIYMIF